MILPVRKLMEAKYSARPMKANRWRIVVSRRSGCLMLGDGSESLSGAVGRCAVDVDVSCLGGCVIFEWKSPRVQDLG